MRISDWSSDVCSSDLGLVGVVLPVLPTTIFWIIAAACFAKSCPAMARKIYAWPGVGPAVEAFLSHGVIARRAKIGAGIGKGVAAVLRSEERRVGQECVSTVYISVVAV